MISIPVKSLKTELLLTTIVVCVGLVFVIPTIYMSGMRYLNYFFKHWQAIFWMATLGAVCTLFFGAIILLSKNIKDKQSAFLCVAVSALHLAVVATIYEGLLR